MVGSFTVPAGVSIVGAGPATVVEGVAGSPAFTTTGGSPATRIASLGVVVDGSVAILVRGGAAAAIEDVEVTVRKGIGIGAEDLSSLTIARTRIRGTVTTENAIAIPLEPRPTEASTHGLVLVRVANASVTTTEASGFALAGALFVDSTTTWNGGSTSDNRGTGLFVSGGSADVTSVRVCGSIMGGGLMPSYGAVLSNGADVQTSGLEVCNGEGYGILQSEARARHANLTVSNMSEAGVWVQRSDQFQLSGAASRISTNRVAGIFVIESQNVSVADAMVESTRNGTRVTADLGAITVGDGLQLVDTTTSVSVSGVRFSQNDRVGVLVDVGTGSTSSIGISSVTVTSTATDALGAIAQGTTVVAGWDTGIVREGTTVTNDAAFSGRLGIAGIVSPTNLPRADDVRTSGLGAFGI